jgi:O-acetyl-ADP-ribose deacetylase (regulator of RNase III)
MHTLHLRDRSGDLVMAWQQAFSGLAQVQASQGDIFDHPADAVVSPANSFGYMDGGIDLVYAHFFGWEIEAALRNRIQDEHHGELPVGQAIVLPTGHASVPFMVSAPTMRVPGSIGATVHVYLAFRAALIAVARHNETQPQCPIRSLLAPGMGTGIGGMPAARAARQMRAAYDAIVHGRGTQSRPARQVLADHRELLS